MPIYVLVCQNGHKFDKYLPLKNYNDPQVCDCGAAANRVTVPTMVNFDMQNWDSYISPSSGKLITSYKQRKQDMRETGCVDYEPSLKEESKRSQLKQEQELDKKIDATVDKLIDKMPSHKREKLENELKYSDLQYTRGTSNG